MQRNAVVTVAVVVFAITLAGLVGFANAGPTAELHATRTPPCARAVVNAEFSKRMQVRVRERNLHLAKVRRNNPAAYPEASMRTQQELKLLAGKWSLALEQAVQADSATNTACVSPVYP